MSKKLLYLITEDWFFCSHFIERAIVAKQKGYTVAVMTRVNIHANIITSAGIKLIPSQLRRRSINPLREIAVMWEIWKTYSAERPDIVHHIALKPILYGTIAAKLARIRHIINAPVGMGFVFSSRKWKARLSKPIIITLYRYLMAPKNATVIIENADDRQLLADMHIARIEQIKLIRGAGVDTQRFFPTNEPSGDKLIILPARMLWDKGVGEFVEAARILRGKFKDLRFALIGNIDLDNPASISSTQLEFWVNEGVVEWWGYRNDMPEVFAQSHIVCLPSYREGLPKSLLEAAASGKAIVATDVPGCREIVKHEQTGLLTSSHDAELLAETIERLIMNPELRHQLGRNARRYVEQEFTSDRVTSQTLQVYNELLISA